MSRPFPAGPWIVTLALCGGSLVGGYLLQPAAPLWGRWFALVACQAALGAAATRSGASPGASLLKLWLKTVLWPLIGAGLAGATRLAGLDLYGGARVEWLAVASLAAAHALGEWAFACGVRSAECGVTSDDRPATGADRKRPPGYSLLPTPHPAPRTPHWAAWLLDVRWLLAIAGALWCANLASTARLAQFLAGGILFVAVARPWGARRPAAEEQSETAIPEAPSNRAA